jgi:hypothetical protein
MRRFLLHVLPSGFHRIRHYGFLANANRKQDIAAARELLHQLAPTPPADTPDAGTDHGHARPTFVCRHCGAPMLVINTFARARHIRAPPRPGSRHDRQRFTSHNIAGGICSNHAVANVRGLVLQNVRVLPPPSPLERRVPLRACLATDTHRSCTPDNLRLTGIRRRSNPHKSATLLIGISTSPRFPPLRIVQHRPVNPRRLWTAARTWAGVEQSLTTCDFAG